jgi:hypothetical protein
VIILLLWATVVLAVVALCRMATRGDRAMRRRGDVPWEGVHDAPHVQRAADRVPVAASRRER